VTRSDRRLMLPLTAAGAAVLCCALPGLITFVAGLGLGAWFGDHGNWPLGVLAVAAAIATTVAIRRRRSRRCAR
jgi:hypothetical protein